MIIHVDHHSGIPVYRQIMDQILFHVASGIVQPGHELPSVRSLSKELQVNPMTVSKAFSFLEHDGVVTRRPGRPLIVSDLEGDKRDAQRFDLLDADLRAVAVKSRQLGIGHQQVLERLQMLLQEIT